MLCRYFSIMDIDASGDLSPEEIKSLFHRIDIQVSVDMEEVRHASLCEHSLCCTAL